VDHGDTIEIFDLMGYHPETSEELLPVTPEIVDRWKAQRRKPPVRVDPALHPWFDVKTGRPNIWHTPGENGTLDFFNGPGFHPKTGKALTEITQDFAEKLEREKQKEADDLARKKQKEADDLAREKQKGTSKNRSYSSDATKLPAKDSVSFPFRFINVHSDTVSDRQRKRFFEVPKRKPNRNGVNNRPVRRSGATSLRGTPMTSVGAARVWVSRTTS
jgi:hypothetical protein